MDLRPTQGDEKRVLFSNYCCWKRRPPLCHLDRSAAEWRDLRCQRSFPGNVFRRRRHEPSARPGRGKVASVRKPHSLEAPPSPLSSRPERSAVERSAVSAVLPWKCFSTRARRSGGICSAPYCSPKSFLGSYPANPCLTFSHIALLYVVMKHIT